MNNDSPVGDVDSVNSDERSKSPSHTLQVDPVDGQNADIVASGPAVWRAYLRSRARARYRGFG
jgi:hypothetical protein